MVYNVRKYDESIIKKNYFDWNDFWNFLNWEGYVGKNVEWRVLIEIVLVLDIL